MHRTSGPVHRSIVGVAIAAALLSACSTPGDEAGQAEVRGVTIERGETGEERVGPVDGLDIGGSSEVPRESAGEQRPGEATNGDAADGIGNLVVLRSGPLAVGTVWVATAGDWVGLDAQMLEPDAAAEQAHLDVVLDTDGARAQVRGCILRLVAPDDATFEAAGVVAAEVVVEDAGGRTVREPVEPFDLEVVLAPGQTIDLDVAPVADATIDVGPGDGVQIHCEGRFDRA